MAGTLQTLSEMENVFRLLSYHQLLRLYSFS